MWCTFQADVLPIYKSTLLLSVVSVVAAVVVNEALKRGVFQELRKLQKTQPSTFTCLFFFSFWRVHWFCLGYSRLAQVNDSPRANVFPAGEADFGQAMYRSLERTPGTDLICTSLGPHLHNRALIWPGHFDVSNFGLFWLYPSSLSKSARCVSPARKASLVSESNVILFLRS